MQNLISLFILIVLELILSIDNLIFVNIIIDGSHHMARKKLRVIWALSGVLIRSTFLTFLSWLLSQKGKPIFTIFNKGFDIASTVMICGGLFLMYKTVLEIHEKINGEETHSHSNKQLSFNKAVVQVILVDTVFSFDSILTAGGTAKTLWVMIVAVMVSMICMFYFSQVVSNFIHKRPTLKILALSFLVLIGLTLVIEGWDHELASKFDIKGFVYFGMAFSFIVELLNMRFRKNKVNQ